MNARFESLIRQVIEYLKINVNYGYALNSPHRNITDAFVATEGEFFYSLMIVKDSTITYNNMLGGDNASALALPAGDIIYGRFPAEMITVASGGLVRGYIME